MNNSEKAWKRNGNFGIISLLKSNITDLILNKNELLEVEIQELGEINNSLARLLYQKNNRWEIYRKINKMGKYAKSNKLE